MHYFDLPIFMISFDSHWPIRFCSSGHTNQIPPTPNQLSLSLSLIGCCHPSNTAVVGHCQWCNRPSFSPFHIVFSLSLSLEIDSLFHYLSITWSQLSFSLIFFFFLLVSDMYLDLKLFFFFFFSISQGHHPLNRIKSVLWVFKVWSRRQCPWWVALAGNYLGQFRVFWGIGCNGFWYSVLSEII